jgi:hypothetical protein
MFSIVHKYKKSSAQSCLWNWLGCIFLQLIIIILKGLSHKIYIG